MDIDELCAEVNRILAKEGIEVTDGRTAAVVTPRNVRYYRTIGLIDAPRREGGRAVYDGSHVEAIVAIKRAQSAGESLESLRLGRHPLPAPPRLSMSFRGGLSGAMASSRSRAEPAMRWRSAFINMAPDPSSSPGQQEMGWSVRIGDATLSGSGPAPTKAQIEAIQAILAAGEGD